MSEEAKSPTPHTDAVACDGWSGDAECVRADFARELEAELTRARGTWAELLAASSLRLAATEAALTQSTAALAASEAGAAGLREALDECHPAKVWDLARMYYTGDLHNQAAGDRCKEIHHARCKMTDAALATPRHEHTKIFASLVVEWRLMANRAKGNPDAAAAFEACADVLEETLAP